MTWEQVHSENRDVRSRYGRSRSGVIFLGFPPDEVKRMRGSGVARPDDCLHRGRANPFMVRARPLRVMLDPALDHDHRDVKNALKLARQDKVVELLATSIDANEFTQQVKRVELKRLDYITDHEAWGAVIGDSGILVSMFDNYASFASHTFGNMSDPDAHRAVLTAQTAHAVGCDVFLTTNVDLLEAANSTSSWIAELAPISPIDFARMTAILFRTSGFLPVAENSTVRGGVYDATVQEWLPAYLPLYRHLCAQNDCGDILDYMDGVLGSCALALMALDRLACLHFAEDTEPASNRTVGQQQYESAAFAIALISALESLTWVLFKMAGARGNRKSITFRRLLEQNDSKKMPEWVDSVENYCPSSIGAFRTGFVPALELVMHLRDVVQHHVPIPAAVGVFGKTVTVSGDNRFIDELKLGVLVINPHPGQSPYRWPKSDEAMGVLPGAVIPYPYFRTCIHDLFTLVEAVLEAVCAREAVQIETAINSHFGAWLGYPDPELIGFLTKHL